MMTSTDQFPNFATSLNASQSLLHAPQKAMDDEWKDLLNSISSSSSDDRARPVSPSDDLDFDFGLPLFEHDEIQAADLSTPFLMPACEDTYSRKHHMDPDEHYMLQWDSCQCPSSPLPRKTEHTVSPSPMSEQETITIKHSTSFSVLSAAIDLVPGPIIKRMKRVASLTAIAA